MAAEKDDGSRPRAVVVGHFPHLAAIAEYADVAVLERAARADMDLPDTACEYLLPDADLVVMTGMTLANKTMQDGQPLTFVIDDEPVTVGIDLNSNTGIRFAQGDEQQWKERGKRDWDKFTFGCYGCWVTDDEGNHDYVLEDEYSEELWNEQKKSAQRNASLRK